jgi:hypothetical protein
MVLNVIVPINRLCAKNSALSRASFGKNSDAGVFGTGITCTFT